MAQFHRLCRLTALMLGLTFCLLIEGGCAASRPLIWNLFPSVGRYNSSSETDSSSAIDRSQSALIWKGVPSVRWSSKERDSDDATAKGQVAAEPAVAANVAVKITPLEEADSTEEAPGNKRRRPAYTRSDSRPGQLANDNSSVAGKNEFDKLSAETASETRRTESSMERLNAALSGDALQSEALPQTSLTDLELRIRIDSLLSQAKQLLEVGQIDKAHRLAQNAHELGETTQLDYSPDEQRPIDIVRQIEGRLETIQLEDDPLSLDDMTVAPTNPKIWESTPLETIDPDKQDVATETSKPATNTTSAAKDATGLARIRRDWSTLFRREKKPLGLETDPVAQKFNAAQPVASKDLRTADVIVNRSSDSESRKAIVMANRSVSLGTSESVTMSSAAASVADEPDTGASTEAKSMRSSTSSVLESADQDVLDQRDASPTFFADPSRQSDELEESAIVPPDFNIVETAVPLNDNSRLLNRPPRHEFADSDVADRESDWTFYYIGFGLCSLLAVRCYRRGAT